jgi:hypothetical protein
MLSPRAVRLLLRHFDALDQVVSRRLTRKRPWAEPALTGLLCDLVDSETQTEEKVSYTIDQLHEDLARSDEPIGIRLRIDTHQYPAHLERWVTQADLGLIINYQDQFEPAHSTTTAWLLQAKRAFHTRNGSYEGDSCFESTDAAQDLRMKALRDWANEDFIRYFLYCPRPKELDPHVREALNQCRTNALSGDIFDYTLGLELRDDMLSDAPTTAAGLFVASLDRTPKTLAETHAALFSRTVPFAWFVVQHMANGRHGMNQRRPSPESERNRGPRNKDIERLVRGDHRVLKGLEMELPESLGQNISPRILPAHTLEISVICGLDRPRNERG